MTEREPRGTSREDMARDTMLPAPGGIIGSRHPEYKSGAEEAMSDQQFEEKLRELGTPEDLIPRMVRDVSPAVRQAFFEAKPTDVVTDLSDDEIQAAGL